MYKKPLTQERPEKEKKGKGSKKRQRHPNEPEPPKKPMNAFLFYFVSVRDDLKKKMPGKSNAEMTKAASTSWKDLPEIDRIKYKDESNKAKVQYEDAMKRYQLEMEAFYKANPEWAMEQESPLKSSKKRKKEKTQNLFNKVIKLTSDGVRQAGDEFKYFFVLTFIPDLQWCHLAPMRKAGYYGPDKPKAEGRPKWMLVGESEGKEVDISASFCEVIKSKATKDTPDADCEEWDIFESGYATQQAVEKLDSKKSKGAVTISTNTSLAAPFTNRANDGVKRRDEVPVLPERYADPNDIRQECIPVTAT